MILRYGLNDLIGLFKIENNDENIISYYVTHPHMKSKKISIRDIFSITLFVRGNAKVEYNNYTAHLEAVMVFNFYPGFIYHIVHESDDLLMTVITDRMSVV